MTYWSLGGVLAAPLARRHVACQCLQHWPCAQPGVERRLCHGTVDRDPSQNRSEWKVLVMVAGSRCEVCQNVGNLKRRECGGRFRIFIEKNTATDCKLFRCSCARRPSSKFGLNSVVVSHGSPARRWRTPSLGQREDLSYQVVFSTFRFLTLVRRAIPHVPACDVRIHGGGDEASVTCHQLF